MVDAVEGNSVIFRRGAVIEDETPGQGQEEQRLRDEQDVTGLCVSTRTALDESSMVDIEENRAAQPLKRAIEASSSANASARPT